MIILSTLGWVLLLLGVLVGMSFLTLFERRTLGLIQYRRGPNKVGLGGLVQPFRDALKLLSKQLVWPFLSHYWIYLTIPTIRLIISMLVWLSIPSIFNSTDFKLRGVFFLCCIGVRVFALLGGGWSSSSRYAYIGALRSVAQSLSYEVCLSLLLLCLILLVGSLSFELITTTQQECIILIPNITLFILWVPSILAELNRTPFDFSEGESELVSGFNIEYRSLMFGAIFIAEYTMIILIRMLIVMIFFGGIVKPLLTILIFYSLFFFIIWVRGRLPRFRYDFLIIVCWKVFLPISLFIIIISVRFSTIYVNLNLRGFFKYST